MKTIRIIGLVVFLVSTTAGVAQTKKTKQPSKKDSLENKQDNFMDMLSGTLTGTFGENLDGNTMGLGQGIGFLELLEKMELTPKEKAEYRMVYLAQSKDLPKKKQDSLGTVMFKKIMGAELKKQKK